MVLTWRSRWRSRSSALARPWPAPRGGTITSGNDRACRRCFSKIATLASGILNKDASQIVSAFGDQIAGFTQDWPSLNQPAPTNPIGPNTALDENGNPIILRAGHTSPDGTPTSNAIEIAPGDTLSQIAERHGTTVDELMAANPDIVDRHTIQAGQQLALPEGVQPVGAVQQDKLQEFANSQGAPSHLPSPPRPNPSPESLHQTAENALEKIGAKRENEQGVQVARSEIRQLPDGSTIIDIMPEDDLMPGLPDVSVPNEVGAEGFERNMRQHDYLYIDDAPTELNGPEALRAVGEALRQSPTPGQSYPATPEGTLNDVGNITPGDGDTNFVRSYVIESNVTNRSDMVINYTVDGQHALDEGFVMRYAEMDPNGGINIVTYGEGNAWPQVEAMEWYWGPIAQETWSDNAKKIFDQAKTSKP